MSIRRTTTTAQTVIQSAASKNPSLLTDIFAAYFSARYNKRNTVSQVRFERNLADNLMELYHDIVSDRYRVGRSMCFIIRDPVVREVFAASFRDRIVHHLLYNWLSPVFEPSFIYDSYSCRAGKGTLFGIRRLEHHIRSCSDNYRKECYVLKLDIEGYFMNIQRQRLFDIIVSRLSRHSDYQFDVRLAIRLLSQVIFNDPVKGCYRKGSLSDWDDLPESKSLFHAPLGCGLPIGNLTSQLFSNIYLSRLDDFVKRDLHFRHYGRYVDDFYLVGNSRDDLKDSIPQIRKFLWKDLGLKLHPRKVHLASASQGVQFLGAVVKPYRCHVSARTIAKARTRLQDVYTFEPDPFKIRAVSQAYMGYLSNYSYDTSGEKRLI